MRPKRISEKALADKLAAALHLTRDQIKHTCAANQERYETCPRCQAIDAYGEWMVKRGA